MALIGGVHGLWVEVDGVRRRPTSKKEIRALVAENPQRVIVDEVQFMGARSLVALIVRVKVGDTLTFVGPDPDSRRSFFGNIARTSKGFKVS